MARDSIARTQVARHTSAEARRETLSSVEIVLVFLTWAPGRGRRASYTPRERSFFTVGLKVSPH